MEYFYLIGSLIVIVTFAILCGKFIAWGATDDEEQRKADFHGGPGY